MTDNKIISNNKIATKTSLVTMIGNFVLAILKFVGGFIASSQALISDAIDSIGDAISSFIVMIGIKISSKKEDDDHPFGHERFATIATIILSGILLLSGLLIGYDAIKGIIAFIKGEEINIDTNFLFIGVVTAAISIVGKEIMFWYTYKTGKKIKSHALISNARNFRMDAISSIGSLIGLILTYLGYPIVDSIVCLIIVVFIILTAIRIFIDSINQLVDKSCDEEAKEKIRSLILVQDGVLGIDVLRTRLFGDKIYIDLEISVDGNLTVYEGHEIAERVHDVLESTFKEIKHCMVHVNPKSLE